MWTSHVHCPCTPYEKPWMRIKRHASQKEIFKMTSRDMTYWFLSYDKNRLVISRLGLVKFSAAFSKLQLTMLVNYEKQTTTYTTYTSLPLTARPLDFFYFIFFLASFFLYNSNFHELTDSFFYNTVTYPRNSTVRLAGSFQSSGLSTHSCRMVPRNVAWSFRRRIIRRVWW